MLKIGFSFEFFCVIIVLVYEYIGVINMFLDCFKNTGKPYLRIVEGKYVKRDDGSVTVKRKTIKNLGPLSKYDDVFGT